MMKRSINSVMLPALALSAMLVTTAQAQEKADSPLPEAKQAWLLEKFGDQGIDANEDGTLARDEVQAFFVEKPGWGMKGKHGRHGLRGKKGRGHCDGEGWGHHGQHGGPGMRGHRGDPLAKACWLLRRLEKLEAETAPADFELAEFPKADLDGDGELSDTEWSAFAQQAHGQILQKLAWRMPDADTDDDGTISEVELAALRARVRDHLLSRRPEADLNGDGALSDEELEAFWSSRVEQRRARMLERHPEADLDGDGSLSDEETEQFEPKRRGHRGPKHGRGHGGHGGGPRGGRGMF